MGLTWAEFNSVEISNRIYVQRGHRQEVFQTNEKSNTKQNKQANLKDIYILHAYILVLQVVKRPKKPFLAEFQVTHLGIILEPTKTLQSFDSWIPKPSHFQSRRTLDLFSSPTSQFRR